MGGLAKSMPGTFVTYAIGMMALAVSRLSSPASGARKRSFTSRTFWPGGHGPFLLAAAAALLTAFYMTRQAMWSSSASRVRRACTTRMKARR